MEVEVAPEVAPEPEPEPQPEPEPEPVVEPEPEPEAEPEGMWHEGGKRVLDPFPGVTCAPAATAS